MYIDDKFRIIKVDSRNVALERKAERKKKDGTIEEYWVFEGYYSNIKTILRSYLKKSLNTSQENKINGLIKEIVRIEQVIEKKSKGIGLKMAEFMTERSSD